MYQIVMQEEGRGDNRREVKIKKIQRTPPTEKAPFGFRIKFPCLKVIVARVGENSEKRHFAITWSNYTETMSYNPGRFKTKLIEFTQSVQYVTDSVTGRKIKDRKGNYIIDYVAMALHGSDETFTFATKWEKSAETMKVFHEQLVERFGRSLAEEVLDLFLNHDLYQYFMLHHAA
jgi:hypothetical protein